MTFLLGSALVACLVTLAAAKLVATRAPGATSSRQVLMAASAFPLTALLLFAAATALALHDGATHVTEPGGTTGMAVFALVLFLVYALVVGAVAGLPTAVLAIRWFRLG